MKHVPVMLFEALKFLDIKKGMIVIDATFGAGGHSQAFSKIIGETGIIFAFEKDEKTYQAGLNKFSNLKLFNASYVAMDILARKFVGKVDAILFDLGISSMQLDEADRGFSFLLDGPLDMRFSKKQVKTAKEIVNGYSLADLKKIIKIYGEERFASRIAKAICFARGIKQISTTKELENIVYKAVAKDYTDKKHPATRTFQALRIETNDELKTVEEGIEKAVKMLKSGGRLGIISFHSLEDRIVKNKLQAFLGKCTCPKDMPICVCGAKAQIKIITKKPIYPTQDEIKQNRRSRSAIFRVVEKL